MPLLVNGTTVTQPSSYSDQASMRDGLRADEKLPELGVRTTRLRVRGLMVSFGNASGPVSMPRLGILADKGSLYVTRPTGAGR